MAAADVNGTVTEAGLAKLFTDLAAELSAGKTTLSASQMNDLKTVDANLNVGETASAYVGYITNALVNGNAANATWTGGTSSSSPLGNLVVGATAVDLAELADKWFLGTDLPNATVNMSGTPTFKVTYSAVSGSLFGPAGPSMNDVNQGYLGDCYLMASLAEVASQNPSVIESMITSNGNNTYGVRFYVDGVAEYVTVSNMLADGGTEFNSATNIWASLVEQAFAQFQAGGSTTGNTSANYGNSFSSIGNGGCQENALECITGAGTLTDFDASRRSWSEVVMNSTLATTGTINNLNTASVLSILRTDLSDGCALVLSSTTDATDSSGKATLMADHAMSIYGYDATTGNLEIRNPWGTVAGQTWDTNFEVSLATLLSDGDSITVTSTASTVASALAAYAAGTLVGAVPIADSAAAVQANLGGLQNLAAAGDLSSITLTDNGTPNLSLTATQLAQDAAALHAITSTFTTSVSGTTASIAAFLTQQDLSGRGLNGIAADYAGTAPTGGNAVVGFQNTTFTSGVDTVLLDNPRSHYAIQIAADGTTTIQDIGTGDANYGQTVTVKGESYIVFNGANLAASTVIASGAPTYPNDMLFIQNPADAQLAQFYAAILQRIPDLAGLEYWQNSLAAGASLINIAQCFIDTSVFATLIGADPSTLTHNQYVSDLYQSILGRPADPGGLAYWVAAMDAGMSQAAVLVSFTSATAAISAVNAFGGGAGWLVNPSVTGGYADAGVQMAAQTVLTGAASSHFYNLSLIDPTTVPSGGIAAGGVTVTPGAISLSSSAAAATVYLSGSFTQATAANSGDTIHDGTGADSITVSGANTYITVGSATTDTLNLAAGTNSFVFNYAVGKGSLLAVSGIAHPSAATLLNGTTTAVQGSSLSFGASPVFVNIGAVGGGTTTEVVSAANKAYAVADATGEHVIFLGTDSAGDTTIWSFHSGANNHQVIASELTLVATLIGVPASSLTAAELA